MYLKEKSHSSQCGSDGFEQAPSTFSAMAHYH